MTHDSVVLIMFFFPMVRSTNLTVDNDNAISITVKSETVHFLFCFWLLLNLAAIQISRWFSFSSTQNVHLRMCKFALRLSITLFTFWISIDHSLMNWIPKFQWYNLIIYKSDIDRNHLSHMFIYERHAVIDTLAEVKEKERFVNEIKVNIRSLRFFASSHYSCRIKRKHWKNIFEH